MKHPVTKLFLVLLLITNPVLAIADNILNMAVLDQDVTTQVPRHNLNAHSSSGDILGKSALQSNLGVFSCCDQGITCQHSQGESSDCALILTWVEFVGLYPQRISTLYSYLVADFNSQPLLHPPQTFPDS